MKQRKETQPTRRVREQMIKMYHVSGETKAAFANKRGIKISKLRAWNCRASWASVRNFAESFCYYGRR